MAAGDETLVEMTGFGNWHYLGPANLPWTAVNDGSRQARWTVTTSANPASAAGRRGIGFEGNDLVQGGDGDASLHYHATGADGVIVTVIEGV